MACPGLDWTPGSHPPRRGRIPLSPRPPPTSPPTPPLYFPPPQLSHSRTTVPRHFWIARYTPDPSHWIAECSDSVPRRATISYLRPVGFSFWDVCGGGNEGIEAEAGNERSRMMAPIDPKRDPSPSDGRMRKSAERGRWCFGNKGRIE